MKTFWLPKPSGDGGGGSPPDDGHFTARERTVLRRLLRGRGRRPVEPAIAARRERAARRVRRRILSGLSTRDVRSLIRILEELRL